MMTSPKNDLAAEEPCPECDAEAGTICADDCTADMARTSPKNDLALRREYG